VSDTEFKKAVAIFRGKPPLERERLMVYWYLTLGGTTDDQNLELKGMDSKMRRSQPLENMEF